MGTKKLTRRSTIWRDTTSQQIVKVYSDNVTPIKIFLKQILLSSSLLIIECASFGRQSHEWTEAEDLLRGMDLVQDCKLQI